MSMGGGGGGMGESASCREFPWAVGERLGFKKGWETGKNDQ